jgi:hypothetical protein
MSDSITTTLTGYRAAQLANEALASVGLDKTLPPQMFYNYTSARINKGKKPLIACDENGHITQDGFSEWLQAYVLKAVEKSQTVSEEAVEAE